MSDAIHVLLVEDNPGDVRLVREALASNEAVFEVACVERLSDALTTLEGPAPDVIIADLHLPDSDGLDTFDAIARAATTTPIVVLTILADEATAVSAVARGAQDYLYKADLTSHALPRLVRYSIERHRLRSELAELSAGLQQLMRHAAHDLQGPVAAVAGVADLLEHAHDQSDENVEQLMALLRRQSRRLGDLVAALMDIARLDQELKPDPVPVGDVVREATASVPPPTHLSLDTDVPDDVWVLATRPGLERAVTNLLTNAYRYARTRVRVDVRSTGDTVELTVADDGPGVPATFVPDLFRDFTRGPDAAPDTGTGLGLSIVRRLATSFQGEVRYQPDARLGGAAFLLHLPRSPAHRGRGT